MSVTVVTGIINSQGRLQLEQPIGLPPGRVRVTLEMLPDAPEHLPDPPWGDESVPAPFDLPHFGSVTAVYPEPVEQWLPEPFDPVEEDES